MNEDRELDTLALAVASDKLPEEVVSAAKKHYENWQRFDKAKLQMGMWEAEAHLSEILCGESLKTFKSALKKWSESKEIKLEDVPVASAKKSSK